jgi:hypothetical protein
MKYFDSLYSIERTPDEEREAMKFTQGDYKRFCALFYLQTRRMVKDAVMIMK